MNNFEQELVRAIWHGCPICDEQGHSDSSFLEVTKQRTILDVPSLSYNKDRLLWSRRGEDILIGEEYIKVECSVKHKNGKAVLWTAENGWIPELQEIVKGE